MLFLDLGLDKWPLGAVVGLSLGAGLLALVVTRLFVVKRLKKYILGEWAQITTDQSE